MIAEGVATKLAIRSRDRAHMGVVASIADFDWKSGDALPAADLINDPRVSLYCLDHDNQRALVSDAQPGTKLARDSARGNTVDLRAEMQDSVGRLLSLQSAMDSADVVMPGTMTAEAC